MGNGTYDRKCQRLGITDRVGNSSLLPLHLHYHRAEQVPSTTESRIYRVSRHLLSDQFPIQRRNPAVHHAFHRCHELFVLHLRHLG